MKHKYLSTLLLISFSTTALCEPNVVEGSLHDVEVGYPGVGITLLHENGYVPIRRVSTRKSKAKGKAGGGDAPCEQGENSVSPAPHSDIMDLVHRHEFANCFKEREVYGLNYKPKYDVATDFIESDKDACDCFQESIGGQLVKDKDGKELDEQEEDLKTDIVVSNIRAKNKYLQNMTDALRVQALFMADQGGGEEKRLDFLGLYNEKVDPVTEKHVANYKSKLAETGGSLKYPRNKLELQKSVKDIEPPKELSVESLPSDEIPKEPEGACFSMKTFMSWEQQPKGDEFLGKLAKEQFDPENWDLQSLKDQYDRAYRLYDGERGDAGKREQLKKSVDGLKSRIFFLNNNPLYANLFSAKGNGLTPGEKGELAGKKKALFNSLQRKYSPKPNCKVEDSKCISHRKKDEAEVDKDIHELFSDPTVWKATRVQFNDAIIGQYQDVEGVTDQKLPGTQYGLQMKYSEMTGKNVFNCSQRLEGFKDPKAKQKILEACHQNFPLYCQMVEKVYKRMGDDNMFTRPSDDLDAEKTIDFNTNPASNSEFGNLTQLLCKSRRVNRKNPNDRATFAEFKERYCKKDFLDTVTFGIFSSDKCADSRFLLSLYLETFALGPEVVKRDGWDSYEKGFIAHTSVVKTGKDLTRAEVRRVNKSSVSTSHIRQYDARDALAKSFPSFMTPESSELLPNGKTTGFMPAKEGAGPLSPTEYVAATPGSLASKATGDGPAPEEDKSERSSDDVQKEKKKLQDEYEDKKRQLADIKDKKAYEEMEKRLKSMEEMLAKKDEEYKRLLEQEKKDKEAAVAKKKSKVAPDPAEEDGESSSSGPGKTFAGATPLKGDGGPARGPASVPDKGGFGAGSIGGSSGLASSAARIRVAEEKYGITVADVPGSNVLLAEDKDESSLKLVMDAHSGLLVPLMVSPSQYEKFKLNDLDSLKDLYEQKLKGLSGDIVKISISTKGESKPLEFYAIREGDKVIFQPVRKTKLKDLKGILPTTI